MSWGRRAAALILLAATGAGAASRPVPGRSTDATLAVETASGWETWWRRGASPSRWDGSAPLAHHVVWNHNTPGVEWGELRVRGSSEAWRTRIILLRLDPNRLTFSLDPAFRQSEKWTIGSVERDVTVALDAGQFRRTLPFGWVVTGGQELLAPEYAPLAGAVVVSHDGHLRIVAPDRIALERSQKAALEAFQSYPLLLHGGQVPPPLQHSGKGVDLEHRDARLAIGILGDGRVMVALTRFDALGPSLGRIPFGLTTPETAAVMGALGCTEALMLDGGISGQLALRDARGSLHRWPGMRSVPLGLVGRSKPQPSQQGKIRARSEISLYH
jgi:uncharacterized protein YigE (DUF2233 family)